MNVKDLKNLVIFTDLAVILHLVVSFLIYLIVLMYIIYMMVQLIHANGAYNTDSVYMFIQLN